MRKILFRGKRKDNGEWVYGFPFAVKCGLIIEGIETWDGERHHVDNDTVGQFAGVTDKNGTNIFEGDILRGRDHYREEPIQIGYIGSSFTYFTSSYRTHTPIEDSKLGIRVSFYEIIGNIHDNPELLER